MGPIGRASVMEAGWLNSPDNILSVAGGEERFIRSLQAIMDRCPMSWDMVILVNNVIFPDKFSLEKCVMVKLCQDELLSAGM